MKINFIALYARLKVELKRVQHENDKLSDELGIARVDLAESVAKARIRSGHWTAEFASLRPFVTQR